MMRHVAFALLVIAPTTVCAQIKSASEVLPTRKIVFKAALTVADAVKQINQQTKNEPAKITVVDKRAAGKNANVKLAAEYPSFWQALDAVAAEAGAALSLYQSDGSIALVDGKPPVIQPSYHSVFRTTVKRVACEQDFDTGSHQTRLWLEFAWEPWFKPFFMEVQKYKAVYPSAPTIEGKVGWSSLAEKDSDRHAIELDWRMAAPPRANAQIAALEGEFRVIGPEKMLTVIFADLKANAMPQKQVQDGVTVSLAWLTVDKAAKSWSVQIDLDYPTDSPKLDSYQSASLLVHNTIELQNVKNPKQTFPAQPFPILKKFTSNSASVVYRFQEETKKGGSFAKLGTPADWKLVYVTPGRIVEMSVPFVFKNISLP